MKVTPENRHKIVEALQDLKKQIGNNNVLHFNYQVKEKGEKTSVSIDFLIEPDKTALSER